MLNLNGKNMCENCFSVIDKNANCPCCGGLPQPRVSSALSLNSILHGRYVIGKVLGKGGFSITYIAYDSKLDRVVAIKEFFPDMIVSRNSGESQVRINSPDNVDMFKISVQRFYEEAKMISELRHPNIVNVYNLYYENGTAFYTMEYLDGCDLRYYIAQNNGTISEDALMPIVACVAEALETVHTKGLLHRDVAPDNIFITKDGQVKLIDFGAARSTLANGGEGFSVVLKQGFAPVEQYQRHGNQGPWTDIYALGATMYYCLSGKMPLPVTERLNNPQISVTGSVPLYHVIDKMMQINPNDRYRSVSDFKKALFNSIQLTNSASPDSAEGKTVAVSNVNVQHNNEKKVVESTESKPAIKQKIDLGKEKINEILNNLPVKETQKNPLIAILAISVLILLLIIIILLFL